MLRIVKSSSGQDFRITRFEDKELLAVFSRGRLLIPTFHLISELVVLKSVYMVFSFSTAANRSGGILPPVSIPTTFLPRN